MARSCFSLQCAPQMTMISVGFVSLLLLCVLTSKYSGGLTQAEYYLENARNAFRQWKCPPGRYPSTFQKGMVSCASCNPGFECLGGFSPPKPCAPGKYQSNAGQKRCDKASPGYIVSKKGQKNQVPCRANTFQSKEGETKCSPCGNGFTSGIGATKCSLNRSTILCTCFKIGRPVCGMDGKTYASKCKAHCAKIVVACTGKCPCGSNKIVQRYRDSVASSQEVGEPRPKTPRRMIRQPTRRPTSRPVGAIISPRQSVPSDRSTKYYYVRQRKNWKSAEDFCSRKGSQLAVIHSMNQHRIVSNVCQDECWIGADRGSAADGFGWTDESPIDFENWVEGQPSTGSCVHMDSTRDRKWRSADCERALPFVCQNNYNFHLNLDVDDTDVFGTGIFGSEMIGLILLGSFAGLRLFMSCHMLKKNSKRVRNDHDTQAMDENTPLISAVIE